MANTPSYSGIGSSNKNVLRKDIKERQTTTSTQRGTTGTPSPRGHA